MLLWVIPNPVQPVFSFEEHVFNQECPKLLFIGRTPNKNLDRIITAISDISCHLSIIGKPTNEQVKRMKDTGISFTVESELSGKDVADRYLKSDIILFPSIYGA